MRRTPGKKNSSIVGFTALESLETRTHLSVTRDPAGWTVVTPAADTRVIYVSNSQGSDSSNGLSAAAPVKSLAKAQALVRDGSADWVLLKRGDTFEGFGTWKKTGRSADEPLYISAYDVGARPQINSGMASGFSTSASGSRQINNVIVSSLSFNANTYNGANAQPSGFRLTCPGNNITVEDCRIVGYKDGMTIGDPSHPITNSTIRRNEILDNYNISNPTSTHAQGIYVSNSTKNLTIEENVLDHNGWRPNTPGDRSFYNHDIYVYNGATNVVIQNNIISQASFYGVKFNAGGTASGNLMLRNSESIYLEGAATINDNVISEAVDMPTKSWGVGINTQKAPSATIRHNLVTKLASTGTSQLIGIEIYKGSAFTGSVEQNVINNWRNTGIYVATPGSGTGSVVIRNNQITMAAGGAALSQSSSASQGTFVYQGNTYFATNKINGSKKSLTQWMSTTGEGDAKYQAGSYPNATRDIEGYSAAIGGAGTFEDFIADARAMDKTNWNPLYTAQAANAWMWQGFGQTVPVSATVQAAAQAIGQPNLFGNQPVTPGDINLVI